MKIVLIIFLLMVVLFSLFLSLRWYWPPTFPSSGIKRSFLKLNGHEIAYYQKGYGQDILLIHGTPGSIEDWLPLIETINTDRYRVTIYDRLGHGASSPCSQGNIKENLETALGIIDALSLKQPIIVGHSYGGSIALAMAEIQEPNFLGFVLIGPPAYSWKEFSSVYYPLALPLLGKVFAKLLIPVFAESMIKDGIINSFGGSKGTVPDGFMEFRMKLWSRPQNAISKAKEMVNLDSDLKSIATRVKNIRHPITILTGSLDQPRIVSGTKRLGKDIAHADLNELPETGHYPQIEKPRVVLKAIEEMGER